MAWRSLQGCVACPNGTSSAGAGAIACTACQPGWITIAALEPKTSCDACPAGSYSPLASAINASFDVERVSPAFPFRLATFTTFMDVGSVECLPCGLGQFSPEGATACLDCPRGTFSAAYSTPECTPCPLNEFQSFAGATFALCVTARTIILRAIVK